MLDSGTDRGGWSDLHGRPVFDIMVNGTRRITGTNAMLNTRDATQILDSDFLEVRCKILEVAAILDRIERAPARHGEHADPRLSQLRRALEALLEPGPGRAETIQRIFSREYDPRWRAQLSTTQTTLH
jgi:hypothetical protein